MLPAHDVMSSDDSSISGGEMSEEEKDLYDQVHAEDDDLTSGYTTISSNKGDYVGIKRTLTVRDAIARRDNKEEYKHPNEPAKTTEKSSTKKAQAAQQQANKE